MNGIQRLTSRTSLARRKAALGAFFAVGMLAVPLVASADSTTTTTMTIEGRPVPGTTVVVRVVVTGKHLVFVPPTAVFGGQLQATLQGNVVSSVDAISTNSHVIEGPDCIPDPTFTYCLTYKYYADRTEAAFAVALPKGQSSYTFGAQYTGDNDSHASQATPVTQAAVYTDVSAATSLLL
jgi:hypothetical protein